MALSEKLAKLDEAKRTELMLKIKDTVTIENCDIIYEVRDGKIEQRESI